MITQIVANIHFFDFAVLVLTFHENVLEKVVVVLLHLLIGHICHHYDQNKTKLSQRRLKSAKSVWLGTHNGCRRLI